MTDYCVRTAFRVRWASVLALVAGLSLSASAAAQTPASVRVTKRAVVMDTPRSDGFVVGAVNPGEVLTVLNQSGSWYLVNTPERLPLRRGWIQSAAVDVAIAGRRQARPASRGTAIRGFAQAGGNLFTARNSFETILGSAFGTVYGGGGQFVLGNGVFVEASVEQFRKTGSRVLVSGTQLYSLPIDDVVTVTPVHVTAGYREQKYGRVVPYLGVGLGWQTLREESPSVPAARRSHVGYHLVGGAEFAVLPWVAVAGEVQQTVVPNLLGETGASALFTEDDLGGTAFRVKLIVGRW
jgi:hypothetical protein